MKKICAGCGREVQITETWDHGRVVVEVDEAVIIPGQDLLALTKTGRIVKGTRVSETYEGGAIEAHILHRMTCKAADKILQQGALEI